MCALLQCPLFFPYRGWFLKQTSVRVTVLQQYRPQAYRQLLKGFLRRWTRAVYFRTTEGPLCLADWHSGPSLALKLPVAAPRRWNVYSQMRHSISHGAFPGPWRHGHDIINGQWERILCSRIPETSLEDYSLCVLFLALRVWFETVFLIQPYSEHKSLASRPKRPG